MPRYVVWPGNVLSRNDRDTHFVSAARLLELYCVPRGARVVSGRLNGFRDEPGDIHLWPRSDGKYPVFDA